MNQQTTRISALFLLVLVIVPWVPYLGTTTAFVDAWRFMSNSTQGEYFLHPGRPFTWIPWFIVYNIHPDSFLGVQIALIILQWAKVLLFWALLGVLPGFKGQPPLFRLLIVILFAVYSTDNGLFWLGTLAMQLSMVAYLTATVCFLRYWEGEGRQWVNLTLIVIGLMFTVGIHERYYPLLFLTPLLLGRKLLKLRNLWQILWMWYLIPALNVFYTFIQLVILRVPSYQSNVISNSFDETSPTHIVERVGESLWWAYWTSYKIPQPEEWLLTSIFLALVAGTLAGAFVWELYPNHAGSIPTASEDWKRYLAYLSLSSVIVLFGFLPFAFTSLHDETRRSFFVSVIGGAIFWGAVIWYFRRFSSVSRGIITGLIFVFVATHTIGNLANHTWIRENSLNAQQDLDRILTAAPYPKDGTLIWVTFTRGSNNAAIQSRARFPWLIESAFQYVYDTDVMVCTSRVGQQPSEACQVRQDGIYVQADRERENNRLYPFQQVVIVRFEFDEPTDNVYLVEDIRPRIIPVENSLLPELYFPQANLTLDKEMPNRYYRIFDYQDNLRGEQVQANAR